MSDEDSVKEKKEVEENTDKKLTEDGNVHEKNSCTTCKLMMLCMLCDNERWKGYEKGIACDGFKEVLNALRRLVRFEMDTNKVSKCLENGNCKMCDTVREDIKETLKLNEEEDDVEPTQVEKKRKTDQ